MAKKECWVSIAVNGRLDVCIEVDEDASKDEIRSLAMSAYIDESLDEMEVVDSHVVNYTIDGELTDF